MTNKEIIKKLEFHVMSVIDQPYGAMLNYYEDTIWTSILGFGISQANLGIRFRFPGKPLDEQSDDYLISLDYFELIYAKSIFKKLKNAIKQYKKQQINTEENAEIAKKRAALEDRLKSRLTPTAPPVKP